MLSTNTSFPSNEAPSGLSPPQDTVAAISKDTGFSEALRWGRKALNDRGKG
jgi:hypothetical protein